MEPNNVAEVDDLLNGKGPMDVEPIDGENMDGDPIEGDDVAQKATSMVESEIVDMIGKRKEISRDWKYAKKEIWDRCWDHYKQHYDTTNKEAWQSTTFIPASPKVAEVIASNMHSATLGPARPIEYQARQSENDKAVSDVNEILAVDMERSQFKVHWTDILRTLCISGTGIGKIEYKKEKAIVKVKERLKPNPMMVSFRKMTGREAAPTEQIVEKEMLVKDFSCIKNVDPYNIFPEPSSVDITKDNWIIEEGKISNHKLLELANDPESGVFNINEDVLTNNPNMVEDQDGDEQARDSILDEPIRPTAFLAPDQEHKLDEYWGPAPIWMVKPELYGQEEFKYKMVHAWFWLLDSTYIVRAQETPFRDAEPPYVKGVYIRVPGQFWGIGPLELMMGLQIELNEVRNTRMDEVNIKLSKPIAVMKDAVAKGEWGRLVSGPGALWIFDNIDDIKKAFMTVDFDANMQDSWRSSMEILNEIEEVTAANKSTVGTGGGPNQAGGDTFRGQLLNRQTSSERFLMYARVLEITGLSKAYEKMYHRVYQYKDMEDIEMILGEGAKDFQFIAPEELSKIARIVPQGVTTMENKGIKLAQMSEQYKMFSGQPWFKPIDHARRMVEVSGDDADLSIMTDEEMETLNEMKRKIIEAASKSGGPVPTGGDVPPGKPTGSPPGPIAGNTPSPSEGLPREPQPPSGPGSSPIDVIGRPLS